MKRKRSRKKTIIAALINLTAIFTAADILLTAGVYKANFGNRFNTYEPYVLKTEYFEGLERTRYEFTSDKGQKLVGYMYSKGEEQKGIVVMAHGFGGGGHSSYMDCADRFAENGYYVFAYDATGNDESEGDEVGGLAQGLADLDHAIDFVEESGNFPALPIVLFGHSWGGYSVCSVLSYHPEVKAVIECSGFNASDGMFEAQGRQQAGAFIYVMMPFVKLEERIKCGEYAKHTAMEGFENSDAAVMAVHSRDDTTVPIGYGFDIYYERYRDDPRFTFIKYQDRGHNSVFRDRRYMEEIDRKTMEWIDTLSYDPNAAVNKERFTEDKKEFLKNTIDMKKWSHSLDNDLFEQFVYFYDKHI